jgi:hypothetical protein
MDKPRHPNVVRTWNWGRPLRGVPSTKPDMRQSNERSRVPAPQDKRKSDNSQQRTDRA